MTRRERFLAREVRRATERRDRFLEHPELMVGHLNARAGAGLRRKAKINAKREVVEVPVELTGAVQRVLVKKRHTLSD